MKKFSALFIAICVTLTALTSCNNSKEVEFVGGKIESVSFSGMRSLDMGFALTIINPRGNIEIRQADGVLMHFGKVIGKLTLDPFEVEKKSQEEYHIKANFTLDKDVSALEIMKFLNVNKINECTADIYIKLRVGGIPVQKKYKDVPMKELFEL